MDNVFSSFSSGEFTLLLNYLQVFDDYQSVALCFYSIFNLLSIRIVINKAVTTAIILTYLMSTMNLFVIIGFSFLIGYHLKHILLEIFCLLYQ